MTIDLRNLRYFLEVCANGSISRAADKMHIAQPAMSMQIKGMEQALGLKLFERVPHGVEMTAPGERLRTHAAELLARFDTALDDVRMLEARAAGPVTLGLPQSMTKLLTVPLVREVRARWPDVQLQIAEMSTGFIPEQLAHKGIDLGLTFQRTANPGIRFEQLAEEALVLIAPPGTRFRSRSKRGKLPTVRFSTLTDYPLIIPAPEHGLRVLLDEYACARHMKFTPLSEVNAIHQLIDVVENGLGCSLLSYASVVQEVAQGRLVAAAITSPSISRPVYLCQRALETASIAVSSVGNLIRELVTQLIHSGDWPAKLHCPSANPVENIQSQRPA